MTAATDVSSASSSTTGNQPLTTEGRPLKRRLARALRREKLRALLLIAPLLIFVIVSFVFPIADMLFRSVENKIVEDTIPGTVKALAKWDSSLGELPDESVYAALADDMMLAQRRVVTFRCSHLLREKINDL